ncbi:MAG: hypothetical protein ACI8ZN_002431 [Bacteroidia bacterium]|jgi:hypothetical protein
MLIPEVAKLGSRITMYNPRGIEVLSDQLRIVDQSFDLRNLESGLYFLHIQLQQAIHIQRIVVE